MSFVPISDNDLVNIDRIDMVRMESVKFGDDSKRIITVMVGGFSYKIEDKYLDTALKLLLPKGGSNLTKQFFSI